jgi:hypothetical protein
MTSERTTLALATLNDHYTATINAAIERGDGALADELADDFLNEATGLIDLTGDPGSPRARVA